MIGSALFWLVRARVYVAVVSAMREGMTARMVLARVGRIISEGGPGEGPIQTKGTGFCSSTDVDSRIGMEGIRLAQSG